MYHNTQSTRLPTPQSGEYQLPAVMLGSIGLLMLSLLHVGVTGLVFLSYYHLKVGQGGGVNLGDLRVRD